VFSYKVTGIQETITRVQAFEKRLRRKWLMKAGRAGAKPVKAAMIRNAPLDRNAEPSNTWRKSIGTKVKLFGGGTVLWFAVGPRSSFLVVVTLKATFFRDKQGRVRRIENRGVRPERFEQKRRPVLYSHLAERKHQMIARTQSQTKASAAAAMEAVLREAVADV